MIKNYLKKIIFINKKIGKKYSITFKTDFGRNTEYYTGLVFLAYIKKKNQIIKKEWTDYNNHMNMAYYVLVFDQVWEIILEKFKMGEKSAKTTNMSTMVVETHTTYNSEVKEGDEVEINLTFFDHDKKRLHFKMEMIEKSSKKLSATLEMLSLYINLEARKVSEFEEEKVNLMDDFINLNSSKFSNKDLMLANKLKK